MTSITYVNDLRFLYICRMLPYRALKYLVGYSVPAVVGFSLLSQGIWVYTALVYAFLFIPFVELLFPPDRYNLQALEEEIVRKDRIYDWMLYGHVPVQYAVLILFLYQMQQPGLEVYERVGKILAMSISCGVIGINVAHELGHRVKKSEQVMAVALLSTSLYAHFFIEHNKGHHKHVSTPQDPSSARYNEPVYLFYFRTIIGTVKSAWHIQMQELKQSGARFFSMQNTLGILFVFELILLVSIACFAGLAACLYFILAAVGGFLLLESVQYIEHYGLQRTLKQSGQFERVMPWHSWNSDHIFGRMVLYELTRHSDHHYLASRKYQILRHHDEAPQLPMGYPAMILLALIPPAFFYVMNPRVKAILTAHSEKE